MGNQINTQNQIYESIRNGDLEAVKNYKFKLDSFMLTEAILHKQYEIMLYLVENNCPMDTYVYICTLDKCDFGMLYLLDKINCPQPHIDTLNLIPKYKVYLSYINIMENNINIPVCH
jgi:hypothetical protein